MANYWFPWQWWLTSDWNAHRDQNCSAARQWKALFSADCGLLQSPPHWKAQFHAKWNLFQSDSTYDIMYSWNLWLVAHIYSILYVSCPGSPIICFPSVGIVKFFRQILQEPSGVTQGAVAERGSARQRATWRFHRADMVEKPTVNQQKWVFGHGTSENFWVLKFPYVVVVKGCWHHPSTKWWSSQQ